MRVSVKLPKSNSKSSGFTFTIHYEALNKIRSMPLDRSCENNAVLMHINKSQISLSKNTVFTMIALHSVGPTLISVFAATIADAAIVEYNWTLRPVRASPKDTSFSVDCNLNRLMLLINDEYPGPTLRAQVNDTIRINLVNEDPSQSFSLHHHGLHMFGQPYYDGTASASQCAANVLQTQVYEFTVNEAGTHYWHGHMAMERGDGYEGAIIVTDPNDMRETELEATYDEEEVIFLQDWYHLDGPALRAGLDAIPFIWIGDPQSFVINGGGLYLRCFENTTVDPSLCANNCSIDNYIRTIDVESGKTYRLRIIGGQTLIGVNFAISDHNMTIVEVEGTLCEPFEVSSLDVMPGQRFSALVTMDKDPDSYWATTSVRYRSSGPYGGIIFRYKGAPETNLTLNGPFPDHPLWNETEPTEVLERNLVTKNIDSYPDHDVLSADENAIRRFVLVTTQATDQASGMLRWAVNNVTYVMPPKPFIFSAYEACNVEGAAPWPETIVPGSVVLPEAPPNPWNYTEPVHESVGSYNKESEPSMIPAVEGEIIEVILQNARALNNVSEMHPWHLHGYSFYVIGRGNGVYDKENDMSSYNLENPIRRDTVTLLPLGWTAIRFRATNVGVWTFHCTMTAHLLMGMETLLVVSPDRLESPPPGSRACIETSLAYDESNTSSGVSFLTSFTYHQVDGANISENLPPCLCFVQTTIEASTTTQVRVVTFRFFLSKYCLLVFGNSDIMTVP
ncbi:hypothetical protein HJC23_002636 [Cyclotella cryptica]|uniref:L-ascorbate oxidase n=1 Tax=Cyclotella cryptica TaxID=29204 RepID=A0ABD3PM79_9STRA